MRILSIDGGGIRGLIPALVLAEIERRTRRPIAECFDLIAGTSTGGILACGLTTPDPIAGDRPRYAAAELVGLYEVEGPEIFARTLLRRVRTAWGALDERYADTGLREALQRRLGDVPLSGIVPGTEVLLTAYDLERRKATLLRSARARRDPAHDFRLRDVAQATSAAPTYFEPALIRDVEGRSTYALIDGGVFATNPALVALTDQLRDDRGRRTGGAGEPPERPVDLADVGVELLLSLGTGSSTRPIGYEDAKDWGALEWAPRIVDVVFDGISDTTEFHCQRLLGQRYVRLQTTLQEASPGMDDASPENRAALRREAERLLDERSDEIDRVVAALTG
ncbi:patatin-like phospholipase family protein [Patulibacter defluvii]|uniref:patatin-like phospholipase family protein n=1 Tax=Patulibacter defluvii TaxID=3095358 RepID=UPI002A763B6A|nr:patatin-like phospholipase family protein [Patulibacter sp. DM4]